MNGVNNSVRPLTCCFYLLVGYGVCGVGWLAWLWCLRCWLVSVAMVFAVFADYCVGWLSCLTYPQYNPLTPIFALPCIYIHGILHILTLLHAYLLSYMHTYSLTYYLPQFFNSLVYISLSFYQFSLLFFFYSFIPSISFCFLI